MVEEILFTTLFFLTFLTFNIDTLPEDASDSFSVNGQMVFEKKILVYPSVNIPLRSNVSFYTRRLGFEPILKDNDDNNRQGTKFNRKSSIESLARELKHRSRSL